MRFYWLALGVLSAWRITHLIHVEDGPWELIARFRRLAGTKLLGSLLECFYCLSLWIAAPLAFAIGEGWFERLLLWPTISAGAILLERVTTRVYSAPPATYFEDEENEDVMLRQSKK